MSLRRLSCALAAAVLVGLGASGAHAMTFELAPQAVSTAKLEAEPSPCAVRACVLAAGAIDAHSADDFAAFVTAHPESRGGLLVLDSPGGDLLESLALGARIRSARMATTVGGYDRARGGWRAGGSCASGCVYAFLGGVERTVGRGARLGVHQIYSAEDAPAMSAADAMELMSLVAAHLNRLCGSLQLLIPVMKTRPQQVHWLSAGELKRYAVVTTASAPL